MVINGYDIKSEIHRGPVTTVYDANHLVLGRRVILKVLNTQWTKENDLIDRFRREAKICARLDHPNIVKIFDFKSSDDSVFISMEYIEGSTLEFWIQQKDYTEFSDIINISLQILTGLSFAHKQGIIHRDIKPSNIMISSDKAVKITDFGLAIVTDLPGITSQDQAVGSPAFMSPEQAMGQDLDQRSDLFSLGVSLYKLCTMKSPFETNNIGTTIQNILTKDVPALSSVNSNIPVWFSKMIDSLLSKDREDRPGSADIILSIINTHINSEEFKYQKALSVKSKKDTFHVDRYPFLKYITSKIQTRIFIWAFPIIAILSYLIFDQFDIERSQQFTRPNSQTQNQNIIISDSTLHDEPDHESEDIKKTDQKNNLVVNASPVSLNREIKNHENTPLASSSIQRKEKSQLFITAKPWADVYIDSIYYETTPLKENISLISGYHFIELKNPNYHTFSRKYYLQPAESETLIADLKINVGFLNIRVLPWAKIYIDGKYIETSPIENPLTLSTGERIVTLENPNFATITDTIEVSSGKTINKNISFLK